MTLPIACIKGSIARKMNRADFIRLVVSSVLTTSQKGVKITSMRTNKVTLLPGLKPLTEGRNLTHIAKQLKVDQSTINALVNCKRGASLDMALKVARHLGTTVEALVPVCGMDAE